MIPRFFIDRPIFAAVLSIVITLAGFIALQALPIAQFPTVAPPNVVVTCNYPGASAEVVAKTVAAPIEQQVNGVDDMLYMSSSCTNDGSYTLTVTFKSGVNLNLAQVLVQNRVALAMPLLPDVIKQTGVTTKKQSPDILLVIALLSPDKSYDQLYLSNYATLHIRDELSRLPGISDVTMIGQRDYSIRVWVDPDRLAERDMTAGDVVRAIREQNAQVATGQIGQQPAPAGQPVQITLSTTGRLIEVEQFENIVVKVGEAGRIVRLKDIARVELGSKNQDINTRVNGNPAVSMAIFQLPDANALATADIIKAKIEEIAKGFPKGVAYEIRYDTTPFIRESIDEVFKTLRDAVVLVALVVLLFLQNWRSSVIPLVAVPVAIVGTFAVMAALGFSVNNLTLFGLVLAIGIVVDDAIVVVEAVEHHIEHGMAPRAATIQAMDEVSGPVIAIGLVLTAVFVPCAFITGITGQFFRQFALTIATSTVISTFNSLTLSPALAALLLKPKGVGRSEVLPRLFYVVVGGWAGYEAIASDWVGYDRFAPQLLEHAGASLAAHPERLETLVACVSALVCAVLAWPLGRLANALLTLFFRGFNLAFRLSTDIYTRTIGVLLRLSILVLVVYGGMLALTAQGFAKTPKGFIPTQDQGYLLINIQLPDSASLERTNAVMTKLERLCKGGFVGSVPMRDEKGEVVLKGGKPVMVAGDIGPAYGVRYTQTIAGQSFLLTAFGSNFGSMFVVLDPFAQRKRLESYYEGFAAEFVGRNLPKIDAEIQKLYAQDAEAKLKLDYIEKESSKSDEVRKQLRSDVKATFLAAHLRNRLPEVDSVVRKAFTETIKGVDADSIANDLRARFTKYVPEAAVLVFPPPPVRGVGRAGGYKIMIEDRGDTGLEDLQVQTDNLVELGNKLPTLVGNFSVFRANVPQLDADVDRNDCIAKGVALRDLFDTLQIYLGSLYVNDFNRFGRTWQVIVQADAVYRNKVTDIRKLKVRNAAGQMIPLGALAKIKEKNGPLVLTRYNMYPAAAINGNAKPGVSSRQAIDIMEGLGRDELPNSMSTEWTEMAFLEIQAGDTAMYVFGFAVIMVFLVLAAQYESWALPLAIILVVPLCLLSGIAGVRYFKQDINIFTQIGFVVLVGLASKNAILIVEFANQNRKLGHARREAILETCRLRLRPIIMTSLAFVLGVVPLILSTGAGAEMRRTLGITVFSGMLGVTFFGILMTPVFYSVINQAVESRLLASRWLRGANSFLLGLISLRFAREACAQALGKSVPTEPVADLADTPDPDRARPLEHELEAVAAAAAPEKPARSS